MIRLLLDEHISPALVGKFADIGVYAQAVPHVGLSGRVDREIWKYALDHDFAIVTTNARHFIQLLDVDVHPGLIVLRESGLSRHEQWERLRPVIEYLKDSGDQDPLLNRMWVPVGVVTTHRLDEKQRKSDVTFMSRTGLNGPVTLSHFFRDNVLKWTSILRLQVEDLQP